MTFRILLCHEKENAEWEQIGRKWSKVLKSSKNDNLKDVKITVVDAGAKVSEHKVKSTISQSELMITITASPKLISLAVKDLVVRLTAERFKRIPKVQKENKWIILNFVIRESVWPLICGEENETFFDFSSKCFSKVAVGHRLTESNDRILRVEGRDAGLGLAARRIATALTKDEVFTHAYNLLIKTLLGQS